jgi:glycerophosphoryl diester phosphodiesterase
MAAEMTSIFVPAVKRLTLVLVFALAAPGSLFMAPSLRSAPVPPVEIIAHRGASHDAPENTLASARKAWDQAADALEIDIHLTSDGKLLVIHDASTKRTSGVDLKISQSSAEQLRRLDAGRWKGKEWEGEKYPLLEEVLPLVPPGKRIFIEIKCGAEALPELKRVLTSSTLQPDQVVLIGFSYPTMVEARRAFPQVQAYWLSSFETDKETGALRPAIAELIEKAKQAGFDGLNLSFKGPLNAESIAEIKRAGLKAFVWTVNDPAVARSLAGAGIDGITTDRPAWLREQLRRP